MTGMTGMIDVVAVGAWAPLAFHAVATHGKAYACVWLLSTSLYGAAVQVWLTREGLLRFAPELISVGPASPSAWLWWGVCIYLGALFAKGFVERSSLRGRVAPFVALTGAFAALVAVTVAGVAVATGQWHDPLGALGGGSLFAAGSAFGLLYRVITRFTEHDPTKLVVTLVAAPALAALHLLALRSIGGGS